MRLAPPRREAKLWWTGDGSSGSCMGSTVLAGESEDYVGRPGRERGEQLRVLTAVQKEEEAVLEQGWW